MSGSKIHKFEGWARTVETFLGCRNRLRSKYRGARDENKAWSSGKKLLRSWLLTSLDAEAFLVVDKRLSLSSFANIAIVQMDFCCRLLRKVS